MNYLSLAIIKLCPEAEFSFTDDDYSTIVWNVLDGKAPTQAEINAEIEKIKADEIAAEAAKTAAAASAVAKLQALGLTLDEIAALPK